jgi:hypothetical protein
MTEAQLHDLLIAVVRDVPVLAVLTYSWLTERRARIEAEKRERSLLRELADCKPEEV